VSLTALKATNPRANRRIRVSRLTALAVSLALLMLALTSCGSGADADDQSSPTSASLSPTVPLTSPQCASTVARALGVIAKHVYHELSGGRIAQPAVDRVASSPTLIAAAQSGDPAAVRAALVPLLRGQLASVRVTVAGHTLLDYGSPNAVAPVSAPLKNAAGRTIGMVTASEQGVLGYADTIHTIAAVQVFVRSGPRTLGGSSNTAPSSIPTHGELSWRGKRYAVYSFPGTGFPRIALRTYVLAPVPTTSTCARTAAETAANAIGAAAERIYRDEQSGAQTKAVVRDFERSRPFQEAVAGNDPSATEAAIVTFFKSTLHVVRVRATLGGKLVADLGGPHVLAPIRGDVRDLHRRLVGHFLLSIQDDLGYVILAQRFAGVQVFLSQGGQPLLAGTSPAPSTIPASGEVLYKGIPYHAYSFTAEAFPTGALQVRLLIPPVPGL
jgi:hypothetical protein